MADWVTISSLATAGGTLVLAFATFSSVRSANRTARVAEQSLLAGVRPVLIPSRDDDPEQRIRFGDGHIVRVAGHGAAAERQGDDIYLAIALRNGGSGLAVMLGWRASARDAPDAPPPEPDGFRRQQIDLYIPAGDTGFWQGRLGDPAEPRWREVVRLLEDDDPIQIDLMYSDYRGGQRAIVRIVVADWDSGDAEEPEGRRATVLRYFNVDGENPR